MINFCAYLLCALIVHTACASNTPQVHLIVFSKDRPMQLEAFLRSAQRYLHGSVHASVLYHAQNDAFEQAYAVIKRTYDRVTFVSQNRARPMSDFHQLLCQLAQSTDSPYLMFAVDDMIITDHINLAEATTLLEQDEAFYAFFYRLGHNINSCYFCPGKATPPPQLTPVTATAYSWHFHNGSWDWNYPHTVDLTVYRRDTILAALRTPSTSPNNFESQWSAQHIPRTMQGLCHLTSRVVNCPHNRVQTVFNNPHSGKYDIFKLLALFNKGYRINIDPFFRIPHNTPHTELEYSFVQIS